MKNFILGLIAAVVLTVGGVSEAQTAPVVTSGPSVGFLELRDGYTHPIQMSPGLGYQLNLSWFPEEILNQRFDMLSVSAVALGSALSSPAGIETGDLSAGLMLGTMNGTISIGGGVDLFGPNGGVVSGFKASNNLFGMVVFSLPIVWGSPTPAPSSDTVAPGDVHGMKRGWTLYTQP
jgi:hypothetical protein